MKKKNSLMIIFSVVFLASCQSNMSQAEKTKAEETSKNAIIQDNSEYSFIAEGARVSKPYQTEWSALIASKKCDKTWGLFSEGGFTNRGQIVVMQSGDNFEVLTEENKDRKTHKFISLKTFKSNEQKINDFLNTVGKTYQDHTPKAIDALKREFVSMNCSTDKEKANISRILMVHAARPKFPPDLSKLIQAFESLR